MKTFKTFVEYAITVIFLTALFTVTIARLITEIKLLFLNSFKPVNCEK